MRTMSLFRVPIVFLGAVLLAFIGAQTVQAQATQVQSTEDACLALVENLAAAIADCDDINSNWACYGSIEADVVPVQYRFQGLRDRRPLEVVESLDTDAGGVVLMNLHLEGETEPIKTMMFGDASLDPVEPGQHSFIMQIDDPNELCDLTPPGMVLHTESGSSGEIELNGVTIELGSTAAVTIDDSGIMTVVNLEGQVRVTVDGVTQELPVGFETQIDIGGGTPQFAIDAPIPSPLSESIVFRWVTDNASEGIQRVTNTNQTGEACVKELAFGETLSGEVITNPGHECLYKFCTTSSAPFSLKMESANGNLDAWLDLRGPDGLLIAFNNDIDRSESDTDSALCSVGLGDAACYTVVARASDNASEGAFSISLENSNTCPKPTIPRCEVRVHQGLNLRAEPDTTSQVVRTLSQNTPLRPVERSSDENWLKVEIEGDSNGSEGWVRNLPQFVQCEIQTIDEVPVVVVQPDNCDTYRGLVAPPGCDATPPTGPDEPQPPSKPGPKKNTSKDGPFGAP